MRGDYTIQPRPGLPLRSPINVSYLYHQEAYAGVQFEAHIGNKIVRAWGPPNFGDKTPDFEVTEELFCKTLVNLAATLQAKREKIADDERPLLNGILDFVSVN